MSKTVVTYGTSLTAGGLWQQQLESALEQCTGQPWEVLNRGASAKASDWGIQNVTNVTNELPDAVLVEFATNDAYSPYQITVGQSRVNTLHIISRIRALSPHTDIWLMTMNPTFNDGSRPHLSQYFDQYSFIADEAEVGVIDLYQVWRATLTLGSVSRDIPDGIHPIGAAYSRTIPVIAQALLGYACP